MTGLRPEGGSICEAGEMQLIPNEQIQQQEWFCPSRVELGSLSSRPVILQSVRGYLPDEMFCVDGNFSFFFVQQCSVTTVSIAECLH